MNKLIKSMTKYENHQDSKTMKNLSPTNIISGPMYLVQYKKNYDFDANGL